MISSVIYKEFLDPLSVISIAWTPCDDDRFALFIRDACKPCRIISMTETYYGISDISLIICNNRLTHLDKSIELAKFLCCPLLIVDHSTKPAIVNNNIDNTILIEPTYQVALSQQIFLSWNKIQNSTMKYDLYDDISKNTWKNLIYQLCKANMVIKDEQTTEKQK